jgi:hypothetical protein
VRLALADEELSNHEREHVAQVEYGRGLVRRRREPAAAAWRLSRATGDAVGATEHAVAVRVRASNPLSPMEPVSLPPRNVQ